MGTREISAVLVVLIVFVSAAMAAGPSPNAKATRVDGVIAAIDLDAQTLVVGDTTVQVTPTTIIWIGDAVVGLDALTVGDTVVVCGVVDDAGILWAHHINVKYVGN